MHLACPLIDSQNVPAFLLPTKQSRYRDNRADGCCNSEQHDANYNCGRSLVLQKERHAET